MGPFWLHFGPILDPTSLRIASGREKIVLGTSLENHFVFGSVSGGPGAEVTGGAEADTAGLGAPIHFAVEQSDGRQ